MDVFLAQGFLGINDGEQSAMGWVSQKPQGKSIYEVGYEVHETIGSMGWL